MVKSQTKCFPSAKLAIFINIFIGRAKFGSLDELNSMTSQRSKNTSFSKELVSVHRNIVSIYDFLKCLK